MRATIGKLLKQHTPPTEVGVMREHAEYLGCKYHGAPSIKPKGFTGGIVPGKQIGGVVMVRLQDIYKALKNAKGIDES